MARRRSALEQEVLHISLSPGEDGYVVAQCPDIPGCVSQGKTREEALANIHDAISASLQVMFEDAFHELKKRSRQSPAIPSSYKVKVSQPRFKLFPA